MKKIRVIYLTLVLGVFTSCTLLQDPYYWKIEIEDGFRTELMRSYVMCLCNDTTVSVEVQQHLQLHLYQLDDLANQIEEERRGDSDVPKYKMALERLYLEDESVLPLKMAYDAMDVVSIGRFSPCPEESGYAVFRAFERLSFIHVTFKINKSLDYLVVLDANDVQRHLQGEIAFGRMEMIGECASSMIYNN